jgi:hypothetical protein
LGLRLISQKKNPALLAPASNRRAKRKAALKVSDEILLTIWNKLAAEYFPQVPHLRNYIVRWSPRRQKRVLGSCHIASRQVVIAKELKPQEVFEWVEPVLYHEMCHAVLEDKVARLGGKRLWHGAEFKALEARHPQTIALSLWMRNGGWTKAVRSARSKQAYNRRKTKGDSSL